jgi:hypothetical protein
MRIPRQMSTALARLLEQRCWHVSAGRGAGASFTLAFGRRVRRSVPLKNQHQPRIYRENEGQFCVFVLCSWRLEGPRAALSSSDHESDEIAADLRQLVGQRVVGAKVIPPAWDLRLDFSGRLTLAIFCDHVDARSSAQDNWSFEFDKKILSVGPGYEWRIEDRGVAP